jgi:hypothetical protein
MQVGDHELPKQRFTVSQFRIGTILLIHEGYRTEADIAATSF